MFDRASPTVALSITLLFRTINILTLFAKSCYVKLVAVKNIFIFWWIKKGTCNEEVFLIIFI